MTISDFSLCAVFAHKFLLLVKTAIRFHTISGGGVAVQVKSSQ